MNTPANDPRNAATDRGGGSPPKRNGSTLWLLLLLALLLLGWLWFSQRGGLPDVREPVPATAPTVPATDATTSEESAEKQARRPSDAAKTKARKSTKAATPRSIEARPIASRNPPPDYPREAQRRGQAGRVLLRVDVAADGSASNVDFVQRSGSAELDRAAMNAVRKWRFAPARRDGKAVASSVNVPVDFVLPRAD